MSSGTKWLRTVLSDHAIGVYLRAGRDLLPVGGSRRSRRWVLRPNESGTDLESPGDCARTPPFPLPPSLPPSPFCDCRERRERRPNQRGLHKSSCGDAPFPCTLPLATAVDAAVTAAQRGVRRRCSVVKCRRACGSMSHACGEWGRRRVLRGGLVGCGGRRYTLS